MEAKHSQSTNESDRKKTKKSVKWYQHTAWIIALLIIFWPVGLYLMWKHTNWSKNVKIVISTIAVLSFVLMVVAIANAPPTVTVNNLSNGKISTDDAIYTVTGSVTSAESVTVNKKTASLNNDNFSVSIDLKQGDNNVSVTAKRGDQHADEQFIIHRSTDAELKARATAEAAKKASDAAANAKKAADDAAKAKIDAAAKAKANAAAMAQAAIDNAPAEYKSALNQATSYANDQHMSEKGVYDQLTSSYGAQFSAAAAQFAIDHVVADWNANALEQAKEYQNQQSMSPAAIHDQLTSSYGAQFTEAQADYAIQHLND